MLAGLNAAASALRAHSTVMDVTGNNIANINSVDFKSKFVTLAEAPTSGVLASPVRTFDTYTGNPYGTFVSDSYGLYDPSGRMLFTGMAPNISVDAGGTVFENRTPIGKIDLYNAPGYSSPAESVLQNRFTSDVSLVREKVNEITSLRGYQANAKTFQATDDMLGTIINMKA